MGLLMGLKNFWDALAGYRQYKALGAQKPNIAFYSEMGTDRIYFEGIIQRLIQDYDQKILYFASVKTDPFLQQPMDGLIPFYIGEGTFRTMVFMEIDVPLFVMTLPDLNTFHLKRSHHPVHYAYLFHSLVSTHMVYRHKAFDAYDTLFCVGPHHEQEIRESERLFNLPQKQLVHHGYPRIDRITADYQKYLQKDLGNARNTNDKRSPHVLVAPSWGPTSISTLCADTLVQTLLNQGYQVTFRPHPMTLRQDPQFKDKLLKPFGSNSDFAFDDDIANTRSLFEADIMVCDWSGVALEFSLVTEKPVIFMDTPPKCNNTEFQRFESIPIEVSLREELGGIVSPDALEQLPHKVDELLAGKNVLKERIAKLRESYIYNIGHADDVGARELMRLLERQKTPKPAAEKVLSSVK